MDQKIAKTLAATLFFSPLASALETANLPDLDLDTPPGQEEVILQQFSKDIANLYKTISNPKTGEDNRRDALSELGQIAGRDPKKTDQVIEVLDKVFDLYLNKPEMFNIRDRHALFEQSIIYDEKLPPAEQKVRKTLIKMLQKKETADFAAMFLFNYYGDPDSRQHVINARDEGLVNPVLLAE